MYNIQTAGITEGKAVELILNACRANENREDRMNVTFNWFACGHLYEATLRNEEGFVVAIACVDQFDC